MKFEKYNLAPELKKRIVELGFRRPTDIQFRSIPPILNGEDVLAISQTGTGKTAAFAIPVLQRLHNSKNNQEEDYIKGIVLVPTRELAIQIAGVFNELGKYLKVKTVCITGGVEQESQVKELESGVDLLIATPGRMFDLIYQKHIKITKAEILVLDEADQMLETKFIKDIHDVKKFLPKQHQTLFFSATIDEKIKELAYSLVRNPIRIQIAPKERVSRNIDHSVAFIEMDDKRFFLERIVKENPDKKIIVFVRTQVRSERVVKAMERVGIKALAMHGGKEQKERLSVMNDFRSGKVNIIVATDVSARGIDIPNVEFVINYDLPEEAENYVHRVGRTGRGMEKGFAVSFCSPEETEMLDEIQNFLEKEIKVMEIKKQDYIETIDFSEEPNDWRKLIKEAEEEKSKKKRKKK